MRLAGSTIPLPPRYRDAYAGYAGRNVVAGLRPEDFHERPEQAGAHGSPVEAAVETVEALGPETVLTLSEGGLEFAARVSASGAQRVGETVRLAYDVSRLHLFDTQTTRRIERPATP